MNENMITKTYFQLVKEVKETKEKKEAEELLFSGDWVLMTTLERNREVVYMLGKLE